MAAERAGIPSVSIVTTGFLGQAQGVAQGQGIPNLAVAEYPGVIMTHSKDELSEKVERVLIDNIIRGLTSPLQAAKKPEEPGLKDIMFKGDLYDVNEFFINRQWSDGLPIIPPTVEKAEEFLRFTERNPGEVIGVLLPESREATVWNIAVNGLMAGCRPEYMPLLIAAVEAIAEPEFRIQDAGSTPGWEPLIILNGPVIKDLNFNYESGVMRAGRQANTSVGRFLRLYMRNVAGLRIPPGKTDKGCFAATFNMVLAENEDEVSRFGWGPFSTDRGFRINDNVVTVQSVVFASAPTYSGGSSPVDHMKTIAEIIGFRAMVNWIFFTLNWGKSYPLLVMSPSIAEVIAKAGWTKDDIRHYLRENVKVRAKLVEELAWQAGLSNFSLCSLVDEGILPQEYCESSDPDREVPVFLRPDWIGIVVSGDPGRNQSRGYIQNHEQGPPISKKILLPADWEQMLKRTRREPRQDFKANKT
ncbi:hypothetical protein ACFL7M_13995 [Thermodesulfobacteriota bacterium]